MESLLIFVALACFGYRKVAAWFTDGDRKQRHKQAQVTRLFQEKANLESRLTQIRKDLQDLTMNDTPLSAQERWSTRTVVKRREKERDQVEKDIDGLVSALEEARAELRELDKKNGRKKKAAKHIGSLVLGVILWAFVWDEWARAEVFGLDGYTPFYTQEAPLFILSLAALYAVGEVLWRYYEQFTSERASNEVPAEEEQLPREEQPQHMETPIHEDTTRNQPKERQR